MSTLTHEEIEQRLKALNDPWLPIAFAARMVALALPSLAIGVERGKPFLWFWEEREKYIYLFSVLRAWQCTWSAARFRSRNIGRATAAYVYTDATDAAYATNAIDAAYTAYAVYIAARATYTAVVAGYDEGGITLADVVKDAVGAAVYAIDAYTVIRDKAINFALFIEENQDITEFLQVHFHDARLQKKQSLFTNELRKLGKGFDYWADWYEARMRGEDLDEALARESCLLSEERLALEPAAINAYLKQLRDKSAHRPLNRVRAIFLGEGEAGKTSLIRVLNNEPVVAGKEKMTPGVDIRPWAVPDSDIQADLWDFGGQVMAHATHQFFLRSRCVYVLVLDGRREYNANEQAEYWLHHVRAFGKNAPVMLVGNKDDLVSVNLDVNTLKNKYPNIVRFYPFSCTESEGKYRSHVEIFKQDFSAQLQLAGTHQELFTDAEFNVLSELNERAKKASFLAKNTFNSLCRDNQVARPDFLLELLDNLGLVIHFEKIQRLNQFVLNPRWLTYGVYTLLYSETAKESKGYLAEAEVFSILDKKIKDNTDRTLQYPPDKCGFLIDAMQEFEISYRLPGNEKRLMIPALLPSDMPALQFDKTHALAFDFDFTGFLPKHVMPGFIVRRHEEIENNTVWRNGVQLRSKNLDAKALVQADYHERRLSLWVSGKQASRYFSALHDEIMQMLARMPDLKFKEWVGLPGREKDQRASFRQLLAMETLGRHEYIHDDGRIYKVAEVLKIMPPEERQAQGAQQIVQIDKVYGNVDVNQAGRDVST